MYHSVSLPLNLMVTHVETGTGLYGRVLFGHTRDPLVDKQQVMAIVGCHTLSNLRRLRESSPIANR